MVGGTGIDRVPSSLDPQGREHTQQYRRAATDARIPAARLAPERSKSSSTMTTLGPAELCALGPSTRMADAGSRDCAAADRGGLADIDIGLPVVMIRRDLAAHRSAPSPQPSATRRLHQPQPLNRCGDSASSLRPLSRTAPAGLGVPSIRCRPPLPRSDSNDKTASTTWRRARSSASGRRGAPRTSTAAAAGSVIHPAPAPSSGRAAHR